MTGDGIPVIDLRPLSDGRADGLARVAAEVGRACRGPDLWPGLAGWRATPTAYWDAMLAMGRAMHRAVQRVDGGSADPGHLHVRRRRRPHALDRRRRRRTAS